MRRGATAAEEAAKKQKSGGFDRIDYFSIKEDTPNHRRVIRLLNEFEMTEQSIADGIEAWATVAQHNSVPTRPAPTGYKGNWPPFMGFVCRKDSGADGERTFPEFADCYICDAMPEGAKKHKKIDRTWGFVLIRIPVYNDKGQLVEIKDDTKEVTRKKPGTDEEETIIVPRIEVANMAWGNFWTMIDSVARMRGTCLDRDFQVIRTGFGQKDTDYKIAAFDPVQCELPTFTAEGVPTGATEVATLDFRDPRVRAFYDIPSLEEFIKEKASDDFYNRFVDIRNAQPTYGDSEEVAGAAAAQPKPSNDAANPAALDAVAARVAGMTGAPVAYTPAPAPAAAPVGSAPAGPAPVGIGPSAVQR